LRYEAKTPFDSIEGAQEYLKLLNQVILEAKQTVQADLSGDTDPKRMEALRLVFYSLEKLAQHLRVSGRLLNDLHSLRRLLLQERPPKTAVASRRPETTKPLQPVLNRELL
jgi:hypothetical protein